jgi:Uma2 family endonuclease
VPRDDPGFLLVAPDLVVEVVSRHDRWPEVREKAAMWLRAGVRLVWVADPRQREIYVYRPGARPEVFTADDQITGLDVIPGFAAPVASLFHEPDGD